MHYGKPMLALDYWEMWSKPFTQKLVALKLRWHAGCLQVLITVLQVFINHCRV